MLFDTCLQENLLLEQGKTAYPLPEFYQYGLLSQEGEDVQMYFIRHQGIVSKEHRLGNLKNNHDRELFRADPSIESGSRYKCNSEKQLRHQRQQSSGIQINL